jgi:hypothetical protein
METQPDSLTIVPGDKMEHEVVMAYLERARELWLPTRDRAARDDHMNAQLNASEGIAMERINRLLDELNALDYFSGLVSVSEIETPPAAS